jgi:DNA-binding CsgD family transcriptional regulator
MSSVVGRSHELASVAAFLDGLAAGPSCLLLEGEAGVGKTTVWSAGVSAAAERSYLILSSRPAEAEATLSFAAVADLLSGVAKQVLTDLPPPQQSALRAALLLEDAGGRATQPVAVCAGFLGAIRSLAQRSPVLIAIDDVQWLDGPSATTLDYALRRLVNEPVGLLASIRLPVSRLAAAAAGAALSARRVERLHIGPLAPADFETVLRASGVGKLSRLTIRRVFDAADGNPFYGVEVARALARMAAEPRPEESLPVPVGLQGVLAARIDGLAADVQDVLLAASCMRSPTTSMLEQANGESAWIALQAAVAEGVLEIEGSTVRFAHPLLASAIYSAVAPARRRAVHRSLSAIVENIEEQARHQALAADGPDEEAANALARAAEAAAARGAPGAAAELAEFAVARTPASLAAARQRRRLQAAEYLYRAGDTARARHGLEAVVDDMQSGPERARARLVLARILLHDAGELAALPVLEDALAEASPDPILQARIHLSMARTMGANLHYCAQHADAGLVLAQQAGDHALVKQALAEKLYNDFMLGGDIAFELDDMVGAGEPDRGLSAVEERPVTLLGLCLVRADRFDDARPLLTRALQNAEEEGDESAQPVLLAYLADLECWTGNWQAAERYAARCRDVGEQVDHRAWRAVACYARALLDAHLGHVDAARAEAADGLSAAAGDDWAMLILRAALGFAEMSAGDLEAAESSLSHAADLADRIGLAEPSAWRFHANYIEVLIGLGDLDRAEGLLSWLEERGRATGRPWTLATAARCRALLLAANGETAGAVRALDDALRHHENLAMPFELARTMLIAGQIQRRAKRKRLARQHIEEALAIFESLSASAWAGRARAELSRIGLRPAAPLSLTATEQRVATLAASGYTNRQVAAELFVSPRTVEGNLARVYRKLGVSSRAELGAAMARLDPARLGPDAPGIAGAPVR